MRLQMIMQKQMFGVSCFRNTRRVVNIVSWCRPLHIHISKYQFTDDWRRCKMVRIRIRGRM